MAEPPAGHPPARVEWSDEVLATKLHVPRLGPGVVARPRLAGRLEQGLGRGLVLVCAPAGFGKTALVADWASQQRRPVAWLSLDQADNDPARFWRHLLAGLDRARPGLADRLGPWLGPPAPAAAPAPWLAYLRQVFLLGVPNEGSFLEKNSFLTALALRRFDLRLARLLADTIDRRSAGIRDLRHARLVDEDWQNPHADDLLPPRTKVPPLPGVQYHVLAASVLKNAESVLARYFGDGLVGGGSATGSVFRRAEQVHVRVFPRQHHGTLLADPDVYEYLRTGLEDVGRAAHPDQSSYFAK